MARRKEGIISIQIDISEDSHKAIAAQLEARNGASKDKLKLSEAVRQALADYFHMDAETLAPGYRKDKGGQGE